MSVQDDDDQEVAWAGPGENVKLVVKNIGYDNVKRGYILCGQQFWAMEC